MAIRWHEEAPDDLREAIRFTAAETGFLPRLIEKDYFCSVALEALAATETALVFKGGTCLAKVHSGFYRLSEDLDFAVSLAVDATRGARGNAAAPFKSLVAALGAEGSAFEVLDPLRGSNASRQYNATLRYRSLLEPREETIRVEISLREAILDPPARLSARTAVLHWRDRTPLVEDLSLRCLSYREAMAEKLRAALSRREPAVRDFFDLDHAVESGGLDAEDGELLELVRAKLAVSVAVGEPIDVSAQRLDGLRRQIESVLRPVLRERDLETFDLDRAFEVMQRVARAVAR